MPRFNVVKTLPAVYKEVYSVDAADGDEAERAVRGGKAACSLRQFDTTPGVAQPAGTSLKAMPEHADIGVGDFEYPSGEGDANAANNARFMTLPGLDTQQVVQEP